MQITSPPVAQEKELQLAQEEIDFVKARHVDPVNLYEFQMGDNTYASALVTARHWDRPGAYRITLLSPGAGFIQGKCLIQDSKGRKVEALAVTIYGRVVIDAVAME